MILARIIGGLGNQMFQYAAARALADQQQAELQLDLRAFEEYDLYSYGLQHFQIRAKVASMDELRRYPRWQQRLLGRIRPLGIRSRYYAEKHMAYDHQFFQLPDGTHVNGYFQSHRYFSGLKNQLIRDFTPVKSMDFENEEILSRVSCTESVMIHVRRGDYVSNANTLSIHGVCSLSYYQSAINRIKDSIKNPHFFIFSNDHQWTNENLQIDGDRTFVNLNAKRPEFDLYLMSRCKHRIIANSTFSWWGAWLAPERGITIAPTPWFSSPSIIAPDIYPDHWTLLPK